MALITDPDDLADSAADDASTAVFIDTAASRIKLNIVGLLSTDGVTLQALYSFLKEEWHDDPLSKNLAAFPFPIEPLGDESFEFIDGWDFDSDATRELVRRAGWTVRNVSGNVTQQWAGVITLGVLQPGTTVYYLQPGGAATDFALAGAVDQAIQVLSDPNGDGAYGDGFDRRSAVTLFAREQGNTYAKASLLNIGATALAGQAYRFPLATLADARVTHTDVQIDANADGTADVAPYSGMSITFHATPQARVIGGVSYDFGIIIEGNGATAEEIYEFEQWAKRQSVDIDAGAGVVVGNTADSAAQFVGGVLYTLPTTNPAGGGTGVYIDNFVVADVNRIIVTDNTGTERPFPFVATLAITFGPNLVADPSAKYWVYFQTLPGAGNDFGESGALIVDDFDAVPMAGLVSGQTTITHTFDYDGNVQGGRTPATDAAVVVVAVGLTVAQYAPRATLTLERATTNTVSVVSALERTY